MTKATILFADNDPDFLDTRSEQLERVGFDVFKATSFEQAEKILQDHWVHLAIIDLRLRDDSDEKDTSGLLLARKEAYRAVPKIILTRFPSYERVREALGLALNSLPPAVDFLAKQEGLEAMMRAVEEAFARYGRINWDLTIRQGEGLSFFHLTSLIDPAISSARISDRASELEDLFRRLFYKSNQVTISRLLTYREGQAILEVFAYGEGGEMQFVVSCGRMHRLKAEDIRYEKFVPMAAGQAGTVKVKSEGTVHFAATAYTLTGGDLGETATFSEFYRSNSTEMITVALDHLFNTTLAPWYERGRFHEKEKTLHEFVLGWPGLGEEALSRVELEPRLETVCKESLTTGLARLDYSAHKLTLHLPDGLSVSYPNPLACLSETHRIFGSPLLCGTTYGQLNGDSVLVDRRGRTWLIDFGQTNQGPLLRDFVSLETVIKFELLNTSSIQARHDMERRLVALSRLDEEIGGTNLESEVQKALQAISRIRRQASAVIGDDLDSYLAGLLFCAVGHLATYDPTMRHTRHELIPYLHSLLSAAMLCQQLAPAPREDLPSQAIRSLWIDEPNKEVWVEGRPVTLSPQEFELLLYLYRHQGQLCERTTIAEQVFGVTFEPNMPETDRKRIEESRINSTMSRLRKKLESNPTRPKYIALVRGEGYKLKLEG